MSLSIIGTYTNLWRSQYLHGPDFNGGRRVTTPLKWHEETTEANPPDTYRTVLEDSVPPLVDVSWLERHIGERGLVVLDATYPLPMIDDPRQVYRAIHLPTARLLDFSRISLLLEPLPRLVPSPQTFLRAMGSLGVDSATHVIVYDQHGLTFGASRIWWLLRLFGHDRVSVLNGGLTAWINSGLSCAQGKPEELAEELEELEEELDVKTPVDCRFVPHPSMIVSPLQTEHALRTGTATVVDARPVALYSGEAPDMLPHVTPGHIPGSLNLPFHDLLDGPSARLLSPDGIAARLEAAGVPATSPVIATCSLGVAACTLALALQTIGRRWSVHDAGLEGWQARQTSAAT
jgi:thiosulfate/3-mercaptopyruvate sulfurtransferase